MSDERGSLEPQIPGVPLGECERRNGLRFPATGQPFELLWLFGDTPSSLAGNDVLPGEPRREEDGALGTGWRLSATSTSKSKPTGKVGRAD